MYIIIQENEILGTVEDYNEALQWAEDNREYADVQIAHVLTTVECRPVTDWDKYNGVTRGVDYPSTINNGHR